MNLLLLGLLAAGILLAASFENNKLSMYKITDESVNKFELHEVVVAVKQLNLDKVEEILQMISDPFSEQYGKYLSREAIGDLTSNPRGMQILKRYFERNNVEITGVTIYGEYFILRAPIFTWEKIFSTTFSYFLHPDDCKIKIRRASGFTLDKVIHPHISAVFNVDYMNLHENVIKLKIRSAAAVSATNSVTPNLLNSFYNIFTNNGSYATSQTIYSTISQYWSSIDLATFQSNYGIPNHPLDADPNNVNNHAQCVSSANNCAESNLDVQYITAVAQNTWSSIIYDSASDAFVTWIVSVANSSHPSKVYSISYGIQESALTSYSTLTTAFNTEAMKLGVMGTTIVVASGDDGAPGYYARSASSSCGYDPSFPASSPYVLAVGATMGPEAGTTEIVCDSSLGGIITSGGGFSSLFTALSHQQRTIKGYFNSGTTAAVSGYSTTGRGLPDVSLAGKYYKVVIGGTSYVVSGTSASAPAVAGMISLVNAARLRKGLPTVGWVNPAIYAYNGSFANDITSGNIKCTASVCCSQGFYAAKGWDPTTGFGSVDFQKLYNLFVPQTSKAPSSSPTPSPTVSFRPTSPTLQPSIHPSATPTLPPTTLPSTSPVTPSPSISQYPNPTSTNPPTLAVGTLIWRYRTSTTGGLYGSPTVGSDGTIYLGSSDFNVYAISSAGTLLWRYHTIRPIVTQLVLQSDDTLLVACGDEFLHAIATKDGSEVWRYPTYGAIFSTPAIGPDGSIYFGSNDYYIYSISADGNFNWAYPTGYFVKSSPAIGENGTVYIGSNDGYLYSIASDGSLLWRFPVGTVDTNSPAVGGDGTIYIATIYFDVFALSPDGDLLWTFVADSNIYSPITLDSDGTLYFGCDDYNLYALTSSGELKWKYTTGGIVESSVAIGADGTLFFGSYDKYVYALTSTGSLKWKYLTGGYVLSNPTVATNGRIYVGAFDRYLYAIYVGFASAFTAHPTASPTTQPTTPTSAPTATDSPTDSPSVQPSTAPVTKSPTMSPSRGGPAKPTSKPLPVSPSRRPTSPPSTLRPSASPSLRPVYKPTLSPSSRPSNAPSRSIPVVKPSFPPTKSKPTTKPTTSPTIKPTTKPTTSPTIKPKPTTKPTTSIKPTTKPTTSPSIKPTTKPTTSPTIKPTTKPTTSPTLKPTTKPTTSPTLKPTTKPTTSPTLKPTTKPTKSPSKLPIKL